jgi:catechol 2,3-dioxygenase-like lactoylglutathione lyase family enzyme
MILNHVQLVVRDVPASRAFYAEWFGLRDAVHDEPGFVILRDAAGGLLALHAGTPDGRRTHPIRRPVRSPASRSRGLA